MNGRNPFLLHDEIFRGFFFAFYAYSVVDNFLVPFIFYNSILSSLKCSLPTGSSTMNELPLCYSLSLLFVRDGLLRC